MIVKLVATTEVGTLGSMKCALDLHSKGLAVVGFEPTPPERLEPCMTAIITKNLCKMLEGLDNGRNEYLHLLYFHRRILYFLL